MARGDNYQSFYPTKNLTLLDAKVGQPNGWVSKDGMWAAVPSNGRKFAIVHNGIISNYQELRDNLLKKGVVFDSMTDTEVFIKLLESAVS